MLEKTGRLQSTEPTPLYQPTDERFGRSGVDVSSLTQWLEGLSELLRSINAGTAKRVLMDSIAEMACSLLDLDKCALLIADSQGERLNVAGSSGLSRAYIDLVNGSRPISLQEQGPTYSSPSAQAYLTRAVVLIPSASHASEFSPWRDMAHDEGYESLIAAPLADEGPPLGVMVGYCQRERRFSTEHIEALRLLARFACTALITARLRADSRVMIEELHQANSELLTRQRLLADQDLQHDQLMHTVASNVGVAGVTSALAQLLRTPVCLQDVDGPVLAEERLHLGEREFSRRDELMRTVHAWGDHRLSTTQHFPDEGIVVRPIILDATPTAFLWVGPRDTRLDPIPTQLLDRFAMAVALELAKAIPLEQARRASARDVVAQLVAADDVEGWRAAANRAASLGFDATRSLQIALVEHPALPGGLQVPDPSEFLEKCSAQTEFPILIGGDQHCSVVIMQTEEAESAEQFLREVTTQLNVRNLYTHVRCVVACAPRGTQDLERLHRGLRGALSIVATTPSDTVMRVDLMGLTGLLLTHGAPESLRSFADQVLGELLDPTDTARELLRTLRVWLDCGGSGSEAAADLHLHPNTVKYRLKNIEGYLGKNLKDPVALTEVRLALDIACLGRAQALS